MYAPNIRFKQQQVIVLGEECARAKPHPDPYLRAMELIGVAPHESLVIEDSPAGAFDEGRMFGMCGAV